MASTWDILREATGPGEQIIVRIRRSSASSPTDYRIFENEQKLRDEWGDDVAGELLNDGYADVGGDWAEVLTPETIKSEIDELRQILAKLRF